MINNVVIVGIGSIAERHRRNVKLLFPKSKVYAISSSGRKPTKEISNCDQLLDNISDLSTMRIDLAIIASPAPFHAKHAIPLINDGVPTLIEKPVSTTLEDVKEIILSAKKKKTPVAVGYCLRFLPSTVVMRNIIQNKSIGQIYNVFIEVGQYLPLWRPDKNYKNSVSANEHLGGGVLFELSHEFDYCQWIFGDLTIQHATLRSTKELSLKVEDCADVVATTNRGGLVYFHLDFLQRNAHRSCRVVGSSGVLTWNLINNEVTLCDNSGQRIIYSNPGWDKNRMYLDMLETFTLGASDRDEKVASLEEALNTVQLIQDIKANHKSFRIGTQGN